MATDLKISELAADTEVVGTDLIPIVDVTANQTKKITFEDFVKSIHGDDIFTPTPQSTEAVGENIVVDPNINEWTDGAPDHYSVEVFGAGGAVEEETNPANVYAGTSSAKITGTSSGVGPGGILEYADTGLTPGALYRSAIMAKCGNAIRIEAVYLNAIPYASATEYYDVEASEWVTISEGHLNTETITEQAVEFEEGGANYIPVPSSGTIAIGLFTIGDETHQSATGYIGEVSLAPVTRPEVNVNVGIGRLLSITKDVNLTEGGQGLIPIYTVPTGSKVLLPWIATESQFSEDIISAGEYSIGTNAPDYNDVTTSDSFPGETGFVESMDRTDSTPRYMKALNAGDTVYFKLNTKWDAEDAIATLYLLGTEIKVPE